MMRHQTRSKNTNLKHGTYLIVESETNSKQFIAELIRPVKAKNEKGAQEQ
jgi:hypothetical protein